MEAPSVEAKGPSNLPTSVPFWRLIADPGVVTQEVVDHPYAGSGTEDDPYVVQWMSKDFRNPLQLSTPMKWSITMVAAMETLVVALVSSAYTGGIAQIEESFQTTTEISTLGVSLYVLGFALGPLLWAPMSEMFGRQIVFIGTYCGLTIFCAATTGAKNIESLLVFRFLSGAFGSSPFTNSGGVIADMFAARERGLALSAFALAPFLGPVIGPIIGGFLGMKAGWKWVMGLLTILCGVMWFFGAILKPETYAPVLLRQRARTLSKLTGRVYVSKLDIDQGRPSLKESLKISLSRPFILLFHGTYRSASFDLSRNYLRHSLHAFRCVPYRIRTSPRMEPGHLKSCLSRCYGGNVGRNCLLDSRKQTLRQASSEERRLRTT